VNTNAQVGQENTQQLVAAQTNRTVSAGRNSTVAVTDNNQRVKADSIENVVVEADIPVSWLIWSIVVGFIGWILPSPNEIVRTIGSWFRKKENG
jgi:hypothetical protein